MKSKKKTIWTNEVKRFKKPYNTPRNDLKDIMDKDMDIIDKALEDLVKRVKDDT